MKVSSIRECVSWGYKEYFDKQCKQEFALITSDGSRRPIPSYRAPTGLWGRVKVALSGATARRERACARLNTFSANEKEATFQKVAIDKFVQVYAKSSDKQQASMIAMLTPDAWQALSFMHSPLFPTPHPSPPIPLNRSVRM